jgi:hypothetical protein
MRSSLFSVITGGMFVFVHADRRRPAVNGGQEYADRPRPIELARYPLPTRQAHRSILGGMPMLEASVDVWTTREIARLSFRLEILRGALSRPNRQRARRIAELKQAIAELRRHRRTFCGH